MSRLTRLAIKKFANEYAGWTVKIKSRLSLPYPTEEPAPIARLVGYTNTSFIVEFDSVLSPYSEEYSWPIEKRTADAVLVVDEKTIKSGWCIEGTLVPIKLNKKKFSLYSSQCKLCNAPARR